MGSDRSRQTSEQLRARHPVLVTGATGVLGRQVVRRLLEEERLVRILSRRPRPVGSRAPFEWTIGDLLTGRGIAAAVEGVATIIHCATTLGRGDVKATRRLVSTAAQSTGAPPHLVHVSIVGVDQVPLFYYRAKFASERAVESAGLPWTILRATQFHDLVARMTTSQRCSPVTLVPSGVCFQPVDSGEVASRLVELAAGPPLGRAEDMGGPRVRPARDLAQATHRAYGWQSPVVGLRLPGKTFRGYRSGGHLTPAHPLGRVTFEEYLAATAHATARRSVL